MSDALVDFGDGKALLRDPDVSFCGFTREDIQRDNRRWLLRLAEIFEAHREGLARRPRLVLAMVRGKDGGT